MRLRTYCVEFELSSCWGDHILWEGLSRAVIQAKDPKDADRVFHEWLANQPKRSLAEGTTYCIYNVPQRRGMTVV